MFIWTMLSLGNAFMMVLYNREYFYRIAGPKTQPSSPSTHSAPALWSDLGGMEDFFIPRTFRLQFPGLFSPPR